MINSIIYVVTAFLICIVLYFVPLQLMKRNERRPSDENFWGHYNIYSYCKITLFESSMLVQPLLFKEFMIAYNDIVKIRPFLHALFLRYRKASGKLGMILLHLNAPKAFILCLRGKGITT